MADSPDHRGSSDFVGLLDAAEVLGGFAWTERCLFQFVGSWSASCSSPEMAIVLADHARRHAWHSQLWFDRLPELSVVDAESLVASPSEGVTQVFRTMDESGDDLTRLVGVYRVMCPHLLSTYDAEIARFGDVAAPSVRRWATFIRGDLIEQWLWGESRIRSLAVDEATVDLAIEGQRSFERHLV
ncbi:MAG: hypothetical protein V9F03_09980 [Microthrixaceae bacterium]